MQVLVEFNHISPVSSIYTRDGNFIAFKGFSYGILLNPGTNLVARLWTLSNFSISVLKRGWHTTLAYSRWGRTANVRSKQALYNIGISVNKWPLYKSEYLISFSHCMSDVSGELQFIVYPYTQVFLFRYYSQRDWNTILVHCVFCTVTTMPQVHNLALAAVKLYLLLMRPVLNGIQIWL